MEDTPSIEGAQRDSLRGREEGRGLSGFRGNKEQSLRKRNIPTTVRVV